MINRIQNLLEDISSAKVDSLPELELFRLKYLSKKGLITELFEEFRGISADVKKMSARSLMN